MNGPTALETNRVRLVSPATEFAEDLFSYGRDPRFYQWVGSAPFLSIADAHSFLQKLALANAEGRRCYWVMLDKAANRAFGTIGLNFVDVPAGVVDFGYGLHPDYWGSGWFREAAGAVIKYAFEVLEFRRIQVMTRSDNIRSVESVKRLGFRPEGLLRAYYATVHGAVDCAVLGLLPEDRLES